MQVEILSINSHTRSVSLPPAIAVLLENLPVLRQRPAAGDVPAAIIVNQCSNTSNMVPI
jgi:hypothetical protein